MCLRKTLIVGVISVFLFSILAPTDYAFAQPLERLKKIVRNHEKRITDLEEHTGIKVYDADGQYLGILVDIERYDVNHNEGDIPIYNPTLRKYIHISCQDGSVVNPMRGADLKLYFENKSCLGVPYVGLRSAWFYYVLEHYGLGKYYVVTGLPTSIVVCSMMRQGSNICEIIAPPSGILYPLQEIEPPFTVPVALPLVYE